MTQVLDQFPFPKLYVVVLCASQIDPCGIPVVEVRGGLVQAHDEEMAQARFRTTCPEFDEGWEVETWPAPVSINAIATYLGDLQDAYALFTS